jgi:hypothetical protein
MIRATAILAALALSGCATQAVQSFTPFAPKAEIRSQAVFNADLAACRGYALEYLSDKSDLDPTAVGSAGLQGGLSNLSEAAVSPVTIPLSALGSASGEAAAEMGLNSHDGKCVVNRCMTQKGESSKQYAVYDPTC